MTASACIGILYPVDGEARSRLDELDEPWLVLGPPVVLAIVGVTMLVIARGPDALMTVGSGPIRRGQPGGIIGERFDQHVLAGVVDAARPIEPRAAGLGACRLSVPAIGA